MKLIENIEIHNFKSIHRQKIEGCRRINVFVGYPNVGKSNILEAIGLYSYLNYSVERFEFRDLCRVKHLSELFFNQDVKQPIYVKLNGEKIQMSLRTNVNSGLTFDIHQLNKEGRTDRIMTTEFNANLSVSTMNPPISYEFKNIIPTIKKYDYKKDIFIGKQLGHSLSIPFGDNLLEILQGNGNLRSEVIKLFAVYGLKLFIDAKDQSISFIRELADGTLVSVPYNQVADTLIRLIFFKAAIETNKDCAIILEEPEAHMFPPYIRKFTTDVIFDKSNQYFIATHSPYVLDALMEDAKDELSVFLVDYKDGETRVNLLTDDDIQEARTFGVDLFYNLESYLKRWIRQ